LGERGKKKRGSGEKNPSAKEAKKERRVPPRTEKKKESLEKGNVLRPAVKKGREKLPRDRGGRRVREKDIAQLLAKGGGKRRVILYSFNKEGGGERC